MVVFQVVIAEEIHHNDRLQVLEENCWDYNVKNEWWTYRWCYKKSVDQLHFHGRGSEPSVHNRISRYESDEVGDSTVQHFCGEEADCVTEDGDLLKRMAKVTIRCCSAKSSLNPRRTTRVDVRLDTYIRRVYEHSTCHYNIDVCSELLCERTEQTATEKESMTQDISHPNTPSPLTKNGYGHQNSGSSSKNGGGPSSRGGSVNASSNPHDGRNTAPEASSNSLEADFLFQGDVVTIEQQSHLKERVRAM